MTDITFATILIFVTVFIAVLCALAVWAYVIDRNRGLFGDSLPRHTDEERFL